MPIWTRNRLQPNQLIIWKPLIRPVCLVYQEASPWKTAENITIQVLNKTRVGYHMLLGGYGVYDIKALTHDPHGVSYIFWSLTRRSTTSVSIVSRYPIHHIFTSGPTRLWLYRRWWVCFDSIHWDNGNVEPVDGGRIEILRRNECWVCSAGWRTVLRLKWLLMNSSRNGRGCGCLLTFSRVRADSIRRQ